MSLQHVQLVSSYSGREIICGRRVEPPKKIWQLTLNAFTNPSRISNRSKKSDVSNQNVTSITQSSSDFEIVRPVENKQSESSDSLHSTQAGCRFHPNWKESFLWTEHNASRDVITCEVCSWAKKKTTKLPQQLS